MGKKILIEGPDGAGKSTLVQKYAIQHNADIMQMTKQGNKTLMNYYGIGQIDYGDWISDRSFVSEWVYSKVYHRSSSISSEYIFRNLIAVYLVNGWDFVLLNVQPEILYRRIQLRGIDEEKMEDLMNLCEAYDSAYKIIFEVARVLECEGQVILIDNN